MKHNCLSLQRTTQPNRKKKAGQDEHTNRQAIRLDSNMQPNVSEAGQTHCAENGRAAPQIP